MREQERNESPTMFFGRVLTREVVDIVDAGKEKPRPRLWNAEKRPEVPAKALPIMPAGRQATHASAFSRHVVDLSPFAERTSDAARPDLDFEQKLNVFADSVRSAVSSRVEEHRVPLLRKPGARAPRAPIGDFLKLPFALLALPFRAKSSLSLAKRGRGEFSKRQTHPDPLLISREGVEPAGLKAAPLPAQASAPVARKAVQVPLPPFKEVIIKTMPRVEREIIFMPRIDWRRRVLAFAVIALVISLPLQALLSYGGLTAKAGAIVAGAKDAASGLRDAGVSALALDGASQASFDRAAGAFAETRDRVDDISVRLAALLTGNQGKLSSGEHALAAGEAVARAGAELSIGVETMRTSQGTVAQKLSDMTVALGKALPYLETSTSELSQVSDRSLPVALRAPFQAIRADAAGAVSDLKRASASSSVLLDAIGANGKRRYLVVFENSNELRPTGGFIGSYALMDLEDGSIKNIDIPAGGSYDLRAGFNQLIAAPEQLRLVNPRWEFQDAKWFADFPTSARSLTWFYEKSGGPTIDGVIAVTSNVMQDLLRRIGPIELPEKGRTVTADNFMLETQKAVEIEYDRETNKPKQIISDMAPKVLQKLIDGGANDLPALASALDASLASKDIQVYFTDPSAQAAAADFGWTGALQPVEGADFLSVVDTNIAGGKTDGVVSEDVRHETRVENGGSIVDTVTISRAHHGKLGELFTGIKNIDYLRVYVPKGSVLISAEGFEAPGKGYFLPQDGMLKPSTLLAAIEGRAATDPSSGTRISQESGLTVFGNWIQLEPGETRSVKISYRLPFKIQDLTKRPVGDLDRAREALGLWTPTAAMKLVVRKQPGALHRTFSSRFYAPDGWQVRSSVPKQADAKTGGLTISTPLDKDLYVGMLLVRRE